MSGCANDLAQDTTGRNVCSLAHKFVGELARDPQLSDRLFRQFISEVEQAFGGHADPIAAFFGVLLERRSPAAMVFLDCHMANPTELSLAPQGSHSKTAARVDRSTFTASCQDAD